MKPKIMIGEHEIGGQDAPPVVDAAFAAPFVTNYCGSSSGTYYTITQGKLRYIHHSVAIQVGARTKNNAVTLANLSAGFRPRNTISFPVFEGFADGFMRVTEPNGFIQITQAGQILWTPLKDTPTTAWVQIAYNFLTTIE
jgi:hypothetical protein